MNLRVLFNLLGKLLSTFSLTFTLPLIAALIYGEPVIPFLSALILSLSTGLLLSSVFRSGEEFGQLRRKESFAVLLLSSVFRSGEEFGQLRRKESFAVVAIIWLLISIFGAIPYLFNNINVVDAFFESMSGFTTTGASVVIPENLPKSLLLWRSTTQWIGGMGIIVLFLVIFPNVAQRSAVLFQAEYPGVNLAKIKPRIRDTAISLYKVYLTLTILEILALYFLGVSFFDAVNHTFATLSTGGFSTHSESIAHFSNPYVEAVIAIFCFLGGTNFALIYFAFKGNFAILKNPEFKAYFCFLAIASLFLTILNLEKYGIIDSIRLSTFQAISIMTTTGFTTVDFDTWSDSAKLILLILMFIGGSSGSTAGGMKVARIYLLMKYSIQQILRAAEPTTVRALKLEGKTVKKEILDDIVAFFVLYILIFTLSSLTISLLGYDILTSMSATATTMGNVGPGMGLAGAAENFQAFPDIAKLLLSIDMWIGRLEIFTAISIFIPSFWREWR